MLQPTHRSHGVVATLSLFAVLSTFVASAVVAQDSPATANVTASSSSPKNATAIGVLYDDCKPTGGGLWSWYYNSRSDGPYVCTQQNNNGIACAMANAYRSGGTQGVHWKYTENKNDPECLNNWKYYSSDGQSLIITVSGRTTTVNDPKRWCALPVYRSGGVKGKQWADCDCTPFYYPDPFGRA